MTIKEVQDRFNECFSFNNSILHKRFQPLDVQYPFGSKTLLGSICSNHNKGALEIKSWYTAARVEKELREFDGLYVQIFRSSFNGAPVQTSSRDHLTLRERSNMVPELHCHFSEPILLFANPRLAGKYGWLCRSFESIPEIIRLSAFKITPVLQAVCLVLLTAK